MPTAYTFDEGQTGTLSGVLRDEFDNPIGSNDLLTLTLSIIDSVTQTVINSRYRQDALNANDVTLDALGNLVWSIQTEDNIIVSSESIPGTVERHEVLFEWTWGTSKYSNELYYFDVTQISIIDDVGGNIYGTVLGADTYFNQRLNSDAWTAATNSEKVASLVEATRLIDRLNYRGNKTSSTQYLEFPRDDDTVVPDPIIYGTYELAIKLLEQFDPDIEAESLRAIDQTYAGVKQSYNPNVFPEWTMAGIISARAWRLIRPYLRDPYLLTLNRES